MSFLLWEQEYDFPEKGLEGEPLLWGGSPALVVDSSPEREDNILSTASTSSVLP